MLLIVRNEEVGFLLCDRSHLLSVHVSTIIFSVLIPACTTDYTVRGKLLLGRSHGPQHLFILQILYNAFNVIHGERHIMG